MNVKQAKAIFLGNNKIYKVYSGNNKVYDARHIIGGWISTNGVFQSEATTSSQTMVFIGKPNTTYKITKTQSSRNRAGLYNSYDIPFNTRLSNYVGNDSGTSLQITTTSEMYYIALMFWRSADTKTAQEIFNSIKIEEVS